MLIQQQLQPNQGFNNPMGGVQQNQFGQQMLNQGSNAAMFPPFGSQVMGTQLPQQQSFMS